MLIDLSQDEPVSEPAIPTPTQPAKPNWLLIAVLLVAGFLAWDRYQQRPQPAPDDDQVVVDDTNPKPTPAPSPSLKGTHLVYVFESTGYPVYIDEVIESETTESIKARGMTGWRSYDPDMDEVKSLVDFAASKQIAAPFVAVVKSLKTMEPVKIEPFPKDAAGLKGFLR